MAKNFVSNKDETVRMFENNLLESLSRVHPSVPLIVFMPVILYFVTKGVLDNIALINMAGYYIFGLFIWTLTEYVLHRFVFHFNAKSKLGKKIHFIFHGVHHDYPSDSRRLVMPPSVSVPLATLFYYLFLYLVGSKNNSLFFAGFITGYLFYDMTHYAIHHFNMHSKFWLNIKNHHIKHHFMDANKGYGVSSPIWDYIIGTGYPIESNKSSRTESFNE